MVLLTQLLSSGSASAATESVDLRGSGKQHRVPLFVQSGSRREKQLALGDELSLRLSSVAVKRLIS